MSDYIETGLYPHINTGFSWVRIDKGNIHTNFRYFSLEQVETVIKYVQSFYEYRNIDFGIVDLGSIPATEDAGDHYRPSYGDPSQSYYYLVQLHRHGAIIPRGIINHILDGINSLARHEIVPESVFIERLASNILEMESSVRLHAISQSSASTLEWVTSDQTVISISTPPSDPADPNYDDITYCDITAVSPGTATVTARVTVNECPAREYPLLPTANINTLDWLIKYTGPAAAADPEHHVPELITDDFYICESFEENGKTKYRWAHHDDVPDSQLVFSDVYQFIVKTFVRILTKDVQRMHVYWTLPLQATSPTGDDEIRWATTSNNVSFVNGVVTGPSTGVYAEKVGSAQIKASVSDTTGVYEDYLPLTIFGLDVTPSNLKVAVGKTQRIFIAKKDIFSEGWEDPPVVNWAADNTAIVGITPIPAESVVDVSHYVECIVTGATGGTAQVTAVSDDPRSGLAFQDSVIVKVGNVAIDLPESNVISLSVSDTLVLTAQAAAGFEISATPGENGWESLNSEVVEVTSVSTASEEGATVNGKVTLTGLAEGSATIKITAKSGETVSDTDTILIKVVQAEVVSGMEMATFTKNLFDGHGVVDWVNPSGEEASVDVPESAPIETPTEEEVEDFIDSEFSDDPEEEATSDEDDSDEDTED